MFSPFFIFYFWKTPNFLLDPSVLVRSQVLGVECHLAKDYEFPDSAYLSNTQKKYPFHHCSVWFLPVFLCIMSKNCVWYILTCYLYATSLLQPQKRDLRVLWDFKCFCRSFIIMWGERTHHKHWHQGHGPSGSSKDKKHDKRQPKFIPDNYSSVDEVRISKISWCDIYIWSPKKMSACFEL